MTKPVESLSDIELPPRHRLPPLLRRAWFGLNQAFRRRIAHTGLTPDQFTALRTIREGNPKGLTQRELTRAMSSDPNTIASLLERMENFGWIERRTHEKDRRAHRIRIASRNRPCPSPSDAVKRNGPSLSTLRAIASVAAPR